jgi:hypothetical protein
MQRLTAKPSTASTKDFPYASISYQLSPRSSGFQPFRWPHQGRQYRRRAYAGRLAALTTYAMHSPYVGRAAL